MACLADGSLYGAALLSAVRSKRSAGWHPRKAVTVSTEATGHCWTA